MMHRPVRHGALIAVCGAAALGECGARSYGGRAWPSTVFHDAGGERTYLHKGFFADEAALRQAIERYALDG